jgi:Icc-related predicted phosphoesterase
VPAQLIRAITDADLIVIAGDITNFGGYDEARAIISELQLLNPNIVAVPGNCDRGTVNRFLDDTSISLHTASKLIDTLLLYGVGGSVKTPFHTPQEYTDADITTMLDAWERNERAKWHVLVTHCPPYNTKLDRTFLGQHVGSRVIRTFIEQHRPDLVICGHIHEARGVDRIGDTICINPGTFPKHFAVITTGTSITYELR